MTNGLGRTAFFPGRDERSGANGASLGATSGLANGASLGATSGPANGASLGVASGPANGASLGVASGQANGASLGVASGQVDGATLGTMSAESPRPRRSTRGSPAEMAWHGAYISYGVGVSNHSKVTSEGRRAVSYVARRSLVACRVKSGRAVTVGGRAVTVRRARSGRAATVGRRAVTVGRRAVTISRVRAGL